MTENTEYLNATIEAISNEPMTAIEDYVCTRMKDKREKERLDICVGIAFLQECRKDSALLKRFYALEFFNGRSIFKDRLLLAYILMYIYGSPNGGLADDAYMHAKAMIPYLSKHPSNIPFLIKSGGGLKRLCDIQRFKEARLRPEIDKEIIMQNSDSGKAKVSDCADSSNTKKRPKGRIISKESEGAQDRIHRCNIEPAEIKSSKIGHIRRLAKELNMIIIEPSDQTVVDEICQMPPGVKQLIIIWRVTDGNWETIKAERISQYEDLNF